MRYKTKLGEFDLSDKEFIIFPNGIPGFEDLRRFTVISLEETAPILWLVSLDDDNVALPVIDPWMVLEDYEVQMSQEDIEILKVEDPSEIVVWSILTIPVGKPQEATVNLKAPILIDLKTGLGCQTILEKYEIKYPLSGYTSGSEGSDSKESMKENESNYGGDQ